MLLVTGGAGFIGSNLVAGLNEAGRTDIVVNDSFGDASKWRNLGKRQLADVVPPGELIGWLDNRKLEAVIHLGAISDTTATDADLVLATNFRLSLKLLDWCTATRTPFIYASSAATYGDGTTREVTREAVMESNIPDVALIADAAVKGVRTGEATILVRYQGNLATVPVTVCRPNRDFSSSP